MLHINGKRLRNNDYVISITLYFEIIVKGDDDDHMHFDPKTQSTMRILILVGALSLHAIFEGLVFGLAKRASDVIGSMAAVLIHKSIIAFSTGMQLMTSGLPEKF